jgi:hypothetical protein
MRRFDMNGTIIFKKIDSHLVPCGTTSGANVIAHWFRNDLQYSAESINEWCSLFSDVVEGNRTSGYQGTGNAFSVWGTARVVLLESEYVEEYKVCLTMGSLVESLKCYRTCFERMASSDGESVEPFSVEFIAEGEQATQAFLKNGGSFDVS